jgi:hypothetical protein
MKTPVKPSRIACAVLLFLAGVWVGWREKVLHERNLAVLWVQVGYDAACVGKSRAVLVNDVFNLYDD